MCFKLLTQVVIIDVSIVVSRKEPCVCTKYVQRPLDEFSNNGAIQIIHTLILFYYYFGLHIRKMRRLIGLISAIILEIWFIDFKLLRSRSFSPQFYVLKKIT